MMTLDQRLKSLQYLASSLEDLESPELEKVLNDAFYENPWFTIEQSKKALEAFRVGYLDRDKLNQWVSSYPIPEAIPMKRVGLVLAGNIPAVGFHDVLCTFVAGHHGVIKLSDKDKVLIPYLLDTISQFDPEVKSYFSFVQKLEKPDAIIATGSNNTRRYFEYYFGKYPGILRGNRHAVAVLHSSDGEEVIRFLAEDIFAFFGLGCRNVSKVFIPEGYSTDLIMSVLHEYNHKVIFHHKYFSNFEYNIALYMLNKEKYFNNGSIILKKDPKITSRIATLHYDEYQSTEELTAFLTENAELLQCVVSTKPIEGFKVIAPGRAQVPGLDDYADGVDTMEFLVNLK